MTEMEWERLVSVNDRAWDLFQASSSSAKDVEDYAERLKGGDGTYMEGSRTCPLCGNDKVVSVREARQVFRTSNWGSEAMLDDADLVCSWCHSARIELEDFPDPAEPEGGPMEVDGMEW